MNESYNVCIPCRKQFTGIDCYRQHIESEKHKKKVQLGELNSDHLLQEEFICKICHVNCTGCIPYEMHLQSEKHIKKLKLNECFKVDINSNDNSSNDFKHEIVSTNIDFREVNDHPKASNGELNFPHQPLPEQLVCKICNIYCTGLVPYEMHLKSEKHFKKLKFNDCVKVDINGSGKSNYNLDQKDVVLTNADIGEVNSYSKDNSRNYMYCDLCNKYFNGPESAMLHYKGKSHQKEVSRKFEKGQSNDIECSDNGNFTTVSLFKQNIKLIHENEPFRL